MAVFSSGRRVKLSHADLRLAAEETEPDAVLVCCFLSSGIDYFRSRKDE